MSVPAKNGNERLSSRSNLVVAGICLGVFSGMVGVSFASVPLYRLFCQVTGYGGTTQRVAQYSDTVLDQEITVRFDGNVAGDLPWDFKPVQREIKLRIGETTQIAYTATNGFSQATRGRASFNVTPEMAGAYFNKVECFCFTDTELKPGETLEMPVVFYVDPQIVDVPELKNLRTITLSYSFFGIKDDAAPVAASVSDGRKGETNKTGNLGG